MTTTEPLNLLRGFVHMEDYSHHVVVDDNTKSPGWYSSTRRYFMEIADVLGHTTEEERAAGFTSHWRWFAELAFEVYDDE